MPNTMAAGSPPGSPSTGSFPTRPTSAMVKPSPRSNSRLSMSSKVGGAGAGSRASDEDARTAVRVAVRIRPPLNPNDPGYDLIPQRFQRSMVQVTSNTNLAIDSPQGKKLFVFDRVFSSDVTQEGVWEYLHDCVNAFVQGYNVSLLAYGQSGAGKSYTMGTSGPLDQDDQDVMGVIPRAATALFEKLDGPRKQANRGSMSQLRTPSRYSGHGSGSFASEKTWKLKATYVEIYNEHLRDLLIPDHVPAHERTNVTIREDTKGNILLTGLRQVEINSVEDLMNALNFGSSLRQTDATAINARSSRSHAVFSLNLVQRKSGLQSPTGASEKRFSVPLEAMTGNESWVTTDSKLHFVDLAGSERLKNTGAQGERAKEGISINAGLAALGKVISQLSSRSAGSHVSYRDSKLTRLLQDSLGGNAVTYMIACVTPAEFHLSETLNTVQYAQRARAIQSKPRIQQVEEGDKQAIIERLKAEVAFLRDQVRSAERTNVDRRAPQVDGRPDRQSERESEMQNQLLDIQENYTTLSQRHAKLIAEMAKARDAEQNEQDLEEDAMGDSATERLNRSNSFAQAVEQVVLEYEKTIQSLEQSLSSTRSTLSNTETSLLERETKCAYVETINTQLQSRLQKLMDRETSTEHYLHDLEAKLDGHTSGEEKNATIIIELRKEIARVRENEASCEDYISTLEERLAEADQDAELMQREIDRLEQVIERQRSLGKLDSLLYELDHIQGETKPAEPEPETNGIAHRRPVIEHSRSQSHVSRTSHQEPIMEADEEMEDHHSRNDLPETIQEVTAPSSNLKPDQDDYTPPSPAQTKFVADKLENVTQELFDLRVEHESTVNEYATLHSRYEEAMRHLRELQDTIDESRHPQRPVRDSMLSMLSPTDTRPPSFMSESRTTDSKGARHDSSRSLSSELSSALESPITAETSDAETATLKAKSETHLEVDNEDVPELPEGRNGVAHVQTEPTTEEAPKEAPKEAQLGVDTPVDTETPRASPPIEHANSELSTEVEHLRTLSAEKELAEKELAAKYAELEMKHQETLDMVEELKTEIAQAKAFEATSPRTSQPVIRRKSSQNVMIIDRAHRSFAALRNIAAENFENSPDMMQGFELNLNAAMHELHARSERIQELEAGVTAAKREMDMKMTIISGLTRERSSLKASPMDMSVVSTLKNQLERNEQQMMEMRETHQATEKQLTTEIENLRAAVQAAAATATVASAATSSEPAVDVVDAKSEEVSRQVDAPGSEDAAGAEEKMAKLEKELASWESKHKAALDGMQATESQMKTTIAELEAQITAFNAKQAEQTEAASDEAKETSAQHDGQIKALQSEVDEYKAVISSNAAKVAELEMAHASAKSELEDAVKARDLHENQAKTQGQLLNNLENQIAAHEQALKTHQDGLKLLQENHARELREMRMSEQKEYEEQVAVLMNEHAENTRILECELNDAREDLMKVATQVAFALGLDVSVDKITERIDDLIADQKALTQAQEKNAETEKHVAELTSINDTVLKDLEQVKSTLADLLAVQGEPLRSPGPVSEQLSQIRKRMMDLESKSKKNSRLVEELEDQLQTNFDQAQITNNRLSTLQTERNQQLEDATTAKVRVESEIEGLRAEYASLQAKFEEIASSTSQPPQHQHHRSNSLTGNLRKSSSVASLPTPPPAIPLPPLPPGSMAGVSNGPVSPSVPSTPTGARPGSKQDNMGSLNQIQEDQEARIRTIEKHLDAERQLTQTLEEALTDLEKQSNKVKADCDAWRKRSQQLEAEVKELKERPAPAPQQDNRWSVHAVEEERKKRQAAEAARAHLEERMNAINKQKKKKGSLNCF